MKPGGAHRALPVIERSGPSGFPNPHPPENSAKPLFRWNPDARLVRVAGGVVAINHSNQMIASLDAEAGKQLLSVSGLTFPFAFPPGLGEQSRHTLLSGGFLLPADSYSEYEGLIRDRLRNALYNSHGLIVMPTEKCNFRCSYCYEEFARGRMSGRNAGILGRAIALIAGNAEQFALAFFGGEPLLCSDLILRFSRQAFDIMRERGLYYSASIATNGYLLDRQLFNELLDVGVVAYQITIDGPRQMHNRQRPTRSGAGTFDRILANLGDMARTEAAFSCVLRCNVRPGDSDELLSLFAGSDLCSIRGDDRFLIDIQEVWASDRVDLEPLTEQTSCLSRLSRQADKYAIADQLGSYGFATTQNELMRGALSSGCYAGKPNWFVVGADLALYKCTVVFDKDENRLGFIHEDGTLVFDRAKNELWTGSNAITDPGCGSCHFRVPCGGIACPLTRFTQGRKVCPDGKEAKSVRGFEGAHSTKQ